MNRITNLEALKARVAEPNFDVPELKIGEPNPDEVVKRVFDACTDPETECSYLASWLALYLAEGEGEWESWDKNQRVAAIAGFDEIMEASGIFDTALQKGQACAYKDVVLADDCYDDEDACKWMAEEEGWFDDAPSFFDPDDHVDWRCLTDAFTDYNKVICVSYKKERDGVNFNGAVIFENWGY